MVKMETLEGTDWDVIISGTGLAPSLLALSLSRSGKKILHLDSNDYYGGNEAALSLTEAETWADRFSAPNESATFGHAVITKRQNETAEGSTLASARAYSLTLAPHLIYARSSLLSFLVSSQIHTQLDFQAIGSWFVVDDSPPRPLLKKVPNGREDIFQDVTLDLRAKRNLMKFLRFVATLEEPLEEWEESGDMPFSQFLTTKFTLPAEALDPILALTMSSRTDERTTTAYALPRISLHLRSIGVFGPGFGSVLPKWGGLAEIAQVACRACAVGGGVYVLGKDLKSVQPQEGKNYSVELSDGETVTTTWLSGAEETLTSTPCVRTDSTKMSRSISIISSPLRLLFPQTSEGGVTPAGSIIVMAPADSKQPPVHVFAHTSEAGECPSTQCVLYAAVELPHHEGFARLEKAIETLLQSVDETPTPSVLWSLRYEQRSPDLSVSSAGRKEKDEGLLVLPALSPDLTLQDNVIEDVKRAWQRITGDDENAFMNFEARTGADDDSDLF